MSKTVLMCSPHYFDIEYEINPWMHTDNQVQKEVARQQWLQLNGIYGQIGWQVEHIDPVQGLPDMVFTANGALVIDGKVALPTFRAPDRQPETAHFKQWFVQHGYTEFLQLKYDFEGEGDALVWNDLIFAGYPWRTDKPAHKELADFFGKKVIDIQLSDERFYHLDTCLTIIDHQTVAIWPKAFSEEAIKKFYDTIPHVIEASDADAMVYGLNTMSDGQNIVMCDKATNLIETYRQKGLNVLPTPISEFQKSGGGVKCLTLELR